MRIKFLKDAEYPQIFPPGHPQSGKPDAERSKSYKAGETYDLPDDHAGRWLRRNAAVIADDPASKAKESLVPGAPHKGGSKAEAL